VLLNAVNLIYLLTAVFHPFMPATSAKMLVQLNAPARSLPKELAIDILPGHKLGQATHLFRKIENPLTGDGDVGEQEAKWKHQFGGGATATAVAEVVEKSKKQLDKEKRERDAAARKAAAEELERKKTPEMRALEEALAAQTERVKALRLGKAEGDVAKETEAVKALKAELAEMKKALV
jgi:methionyl-tRNA synthetase